MYKETLTEAVVRILIRVLIGAGVLLATCLFCRIALFSYGIDTNVIALRGRRRLRAWKRRLWPGRGSEHTYQNYLHFRGSREEAEGLRGQDCTVCLQPFEAQDLIEETLCRHIYHEYCLEEWSQKNENCPLCRKQLKTSQESWTTAYRL